jgi:N-acetylglucosaminyl-diphospho-decaprenol L-rhamnosyltransferase
VITIDVVIPVHGGWPLTASCLEHLRRQTAAHRVILCDNASPDGTVERVRERFPDVDVVELGANLGFSVACNSGAAAGDGDVVVLLNNDVDSRPDFLERLVAPLDEERRVGSAAALLLLPGEDAIESVGLAVDPTLAGYPRLRGRPLGDAHRREPRLLGPAGAGGAYLRRAWNEVGGLDAGVVAYAEDVDLALRLRTAGWATAVAPEAVAVHVGSASAGRRSSWQRYQAGYARGWFLRRYAVLRGRHAIRAAVTEAIVLAGDILVFSRDLAALRGRVAGWRAAAAVKRNPWPPDDVIDHGIGFVASLRLRRGIFGGRRTTR